MTAERESLVDMAHPLADALLKLGRADEHLEALSEAIGDFSSRVHEHITGRRDPDTGRKIAVLSETVQPVFARWGLIAGDFVHGIHSALDVTVASLARHRGNSDNGRDFPIVTRRDRGSMASLRKSIQGISPEQKEIIRGVQPYHGGNGPRLLGSLRTLSNDDKHRILHPARAYVRHLELRPVSIAPPARIHDVRFPERVTLEPGAELVSFAVDPNVVVRVLMRYEMSFEVAFAQAPGHFALMSQGDFIALRRHVGAIIERLSLTLDSPRTR